MSKIEQDTWAKENGIILNRDSCEECKKYWDDGKDFFCGPGHAYEVSNKKKDIVFIDKKKLLLSAIDTTKMPFEEAEKLLEEIEERWY